MSRRKDNGPPVTGHIVALGKKSVFDEDERRRKQTAAPVVEEDSDDDEEFEEFLSSQQSLKERLFGSQSSTAGAGAGASSDAPVQSPAPTAEAGKRKSRRNTASPRDARTHTRTTPTAVTPRKRRTMSPARPQRTSKRIASMNKITYRDTAEYEDIANDDDEDFVPDGAGSSSAGASSSGRGKKPDRKWGRPPGSGKIQRQRQLDEDWEDSNSDNSGGDRDGARRSRKWPERLKINFSPLRVKKKRMRGAGSGLTEQERKETEWEISRKKCTADELHRCMNYFRAEYKRPVNNSQAAVWWRQEHGRDATMPELHDLYDAYFKPWGEEWYALQAKFGTFIRDAKANKPRNIDPKVTERDAKKWFGEFYQIHGPLEVPEIPKRFLRVNYKGPKTKKANENGSAEAKANEDTNTNTNTTKTEDELDREVKKEKEVEDDGEPETKRRRRGGLTRSTSESAVDEVRPIESVNSPVAVTLDKNQINRAASNSRINGSSASESRNKNKTGNGYVGEVDDEVDDDYEDIDVEVKEAPRDDDNEVVVVSENKVEEMELPAVVVVTNSKVEMEGIEMEGEKKTGNGEEADGSVPATLEVEVEMKETADGDGMKDENVGDDKEMNGSSRVWSNCPCRPFKDALKHERYCGVLAVEIEVRPLAKPTEMMVDCRNGDTKTVDANAADAVKE